MTLPFRGGSLSIHHIGFTDLLKTFVLITGKALEGNSFKILFGNHILLNATIYIISSKLQYGDVCLRRWF